jgi:HD-GYP domain-containing protein (c-di-GMP phosphodiesterase class II)
LSDDQIHVLRVGALLHDIGKVGVPDQILQKPGPLTVEEFEILKQHPVIGRRILEPCEGFQRFLPIVELHHENHDGTGYPWHLADTAIPMEARIVHVADAYDAMTTDRPYRRGMSHDVAIQRLRTMSGTQFDPDVVHAVEAMCARGWRGSDEWKSAPADAGVAALVRALRPDDRIPHKVVEIEDHQRV